MGKLLIYLDAGHGENVNGRYDSGAVGPHGTRENDIALDLVQRLAHLLNAKGFQSIGAVIGAAKDRENLSEAYHAANAAGADVLISLHCNAGPAQAHGFEVLYRTSASRPLAAAILSGLQEEVAEGNGIWLPEGLPGYTSRGIKLREDLGILNHAHMIAVLVEVAFISNSKEEQQLRTPKIVEAMAQAIADAVASWEAHR